jgi:monothiol glutaredoxin
MLLDRNWPTVPQVYVNGEFVGGCDIVMSSESPEGRSEQSPDAFHLVHQSGDLETLLEKNKIIPPVTTESS